MGWFFRQRVAGPHRQDDEGDTRYSDETHLWAWLNVAGRDDNLLCLALFLENAVIVKTVCTDGS